ncbi:unnamed protein product [Leuciscus chuanchicus]
MVSFTPAPTRHHEAWVVPQRKTRVRFRPRLSPTLPVFELSTQNRFSPLRETECDAVIIGDSIVRHVHATLGKSKVHSHCFPGARVSEIAARVPEILNGDERVGTVVLHAGVNDIRLRQTEILKKDFRNLIDTRQLFHRDGHHPNKLGSRVLKDNIYFSLNHPSAVCANPLNQNGTHTPGHSMNDHRTSLQNGHDVDISHKDNDNTTEPQQPLLTDTISAEPCPQSSPQTDILELLQDSAPKDDFLENSQGSQDSISQPPITPEQQPLSPDTFTLSPPTPLLCFSQKMEELVHAGTRLSHSFAASPQISTKKRRAPLPPKRAGPAHPPPASVRALRPLPQRQGPHPPPSARDPSNIPNGRKCYYCDGQTCSNTVSCSGTEDRCVKATVTLGSLSAVVKGCATTSICDATFIPDIQGISCCEGNLCNGAQSVTQSFLFLCCSLLSYFMMH